MDIDSILRKAVEMGASDVHLKAQLPPVARVEGVLVPIKGVDKLSPEWLTRLAFNVMNDLQREKFSISKDIDLAYSIAGLKRFRVNVFSQRDSISMVFRVIPLHPPTTGELNLPEIVGRLALEPRGLVLVTGKTASGKSSTLAAMVRHINSKRNCHIITIEDPIEFIHSDIKSIVNQRQVGQDTVSFQSALRAALREDPDVIMVGEMRDAETIEIALLAAETGHLVLSSLHTVDAVETVNRIITVFPNEARSFMRIQLSTLLRGIVSQRLLSRDDGNGRVPAVEVLVSTSRTRDCIANQDKFLMLPDVIGEGYIAYGMQTFDQSILQLYKKGLVNRETVLAAASNRNDMELHLRGVISRERGKNGYRP